MAVNAADAWQDSGRRPDRPSRAPRMDRAAAPARPLRSRPPVPPRVRPVDRDRSAGYYDDESGSGRPPAPRRPAEHSRPVGRPPRDLDDDRRSRGPADRGDSTRAGGRRPAPVSETGRSRLRGILVVLGMFLLTLGGCAIDSVLGVGPGMIALVALVGSTALGAFLVRRRDLLSVVVSPPLVFVAVSAVKTVATPGLDLTLTRFTGQIGLDLISGFVTMASATVAGLVVALIRLAAKR
jgi:hypothetical protein